MAQALEHARLQGEADLLKRSQDEARASSGPMPCHASTSPANAPSSNATSPGAPPRNNSTDSSKLSRNCPPAKSSSNCYRENSSNATEDLAEVRHDLLRLDKKMTVGFLTLLTTATGVQRPYSDRPGHQNGRLRAQVTGRRARP